MKGVAQKLTSQVYYDSIAYRVNVLEAWSCSWSMLEGFPITPLSKVADPSWIIPEDWCAHNRRILSLRSIDFWRAVPAGFTDEQAQDLIRRLKRIAILDRFVSSRAGNRTSEPPAPGTWVKRCQDLIAVTRTILEGSLCESKVSSCPDGPTLFAGLSVEALKKMKSTHQAWGHASIARMNALFAGGYFDDWPASDVARHKLPPRRDSRASDPFNDTGFTEILRSAFWLNSIQADVLQCYIDNKEIDNMANGGINSSRAFAVRREMVRSWVSGSLQKGSKFPFQLAISGEQRRLVRFTEWPLDTVYSLKFLVGLCQAANAIIILVSTGMRIGELMALTVNSLVRHLDGRLYIAGQSFKDTDASLGQDRHWPFPEAAVAAFEAQVALSRKLGDGSQLWVPFGGKLNETGVAVMDRALVQYGLSVATLGGQFLAELDGKLTPHRFRYSVARYAALSLTGASQILFDVLGHKDQRVTLGYMLRDRDLQEDISRIIREVKAVRSKEAFAGADLNGGGAAGMVRKIKADMLARSGRDELETDDIAEAAAILGEAEMVKPGVLCTAQPLERGACSPVPGMRDVGACTSSCMHRLELAANRETRRKKLKSLLQLIQGADLGQRIFYQGQIISNFKAFPDLMREFEADPRLKAALSDCGAESWEVF